MQSRSYIRLKNICKRKPGILEVINCILLKYTLFPIGVILFLAGCLIWLPIEYVWSKIKTFKEYGYDAL